MTKDFLSVISVYIFCLEAVSKPETSHRILIVCMLDLMLLK
jgi:hypothetical protein